MSATYTVQPITDYSIFTTPAAQRKGVQFKADWSKTQKDLARELDLIGARDAVLEIAVKPSHIRKDGQLRSDVPKDLPHRGVRLSFQTHEHGRMSFSCDTYEAKWQGQMADWQANLRAIVLTLEALRAVDRYGVTQGEQYAGFKALGAGSGATPLGGMTRDEATKILCLTAESSWAPGVRATPALYRRARAAAHPDRNNGDRTQWDRVEQAAKVLGVAR